MLHGAAGCVFVVFVSQPECERVTCLGKVLPVCPSYLAELGVAARHCPPPYWASLCPMKGSSHRKENTVT